MNGLLQAKALRGEDASNNSTGSFKVSSRRSAVGRIRCVTASRVWATSGSREPRPGASGTGMTFARMLVARKWGPSESPGKSRRQMTFDRRRILRSNIARACP